MAGEPVTFTFGGSCDEPPCRIQWRWFGDGGSSLGTSMGEGDQVVYAFTDAGSFRVVAEITNSHSTHASAISTQVVVVELPPATLAPEPQAFVRTLDTTSGKSTRTSGRDGDRSGHGRGDSSDDDDEDDDEVTTTTSRSGWSR